MCFDAKWQPRPEQILKNYNKKNIGQNRFINIADYVQIY